MDNGLDIDTRRALLAYHAALAGDLRCCFRAPADPRNRTTVANHAALVARLRASGTAPRWDLAERALAWAETPRRRLLFLGDPEYPALLGAIAQPPVVLFVAGELDVLDAHQVAIVGSRKATRAASAFASRLAAELAARAVVTTSGLAQGIDAAAHSGALRAAGRTVAVLGCGIDRTYPAQHRALADEIAVQGALVSEFPLGTAPLRHHFPQRNRIISALALGTVVVEAALRSGSISTAMHALEQGREVFAVPGSVNNPLARGCHALLKQGAKLIECANDILEEFPGLRGPSSPPTDAGASARTLPRREAALLAACGWDPFSIDEMVELSGLTVPEVSSMLLTLELAGLIQPQAAGTYVRMR